MRYAALAAVLLAVIAAASSAAPQQLSAPWAPLPHPTDSGKPVIFDPQFAAKADNDQRLGCAQGLQCRWRLLGVIQNNGAVELRTTALTW
ncbi:MAG: hypothetical protein E6K32_20120 [Gammaproteobacteria bacterium]|nr:MAG: hypothetical protein E6K32_20120 [Gammaproteobacteria bacterium]